MNLPPNLPPPLRDAIATITATVLAAVGGPGGIPQNLIPQNLQLPVLSSLPGSSAASTPASAAQLALLNATNRVRIAHGLAPLTFLPSLAADSQAWSDHMCRVNNLHHRPTLQPISPPGSRWMGEIIIKVPPGSDAERIVAGWMNSPGHRGQILNPRYSHVGIGVTVGPDGWVWAVENFADI